MDTRRIRRATEADLERIASINMAVFLGDRDQPESALEWATCLFRSFPIYQYFVVEEGGVVAGYAGWQIHGGFHRAEPVIELDQIGVAREHEGKGLGTALVEECTKELVSWMQKKNKRIESCITFVVWGYTLNFNAMNVYAKQFGDGVRGFRIQFGDRAESMFRRRYPLIMPVRDA